MTENFDISPMTVKMYGTINIEGVSYAVVRSDASGAFLRAEETSTLKVQNNIPYFLVSRIFSEEVVEEGINTMRVTYSTPHWVSISGPFVMHWLNQPKTIVVESTVLS